MSWVDGKLLALDLETTGVDPLTARPVSFALVEFDLGVRGRVRTGLVDPGIPIPPETTEIHGVTDQMVAERGGKLDATVNGLVEALLLASADEIPLVGMNLRYDLTVLDSCHRALNDDVGLRELGWQGVVIDAIVLDRHVDQYRSGSRKLGALCARYGVALPAAHNAAADAIASAEVVLAVARDYPEIAALDSDELHGFQVGWHREWAEGYSAYRVKKGDEPLDPCEMSWPISCEPDPEDLPAPITRGQVTRLAIKFSDELGITDRRERLFIVSAIVERPITTTNDLTVDEYREVVKALDLYVGTPGIATILADLAPEAPDSASKPPEPPGGSSPPQSPILGSEALLEASTVRCVAGMDAETVRSWCARCEIAVREGGHPKAKLIPVGELRMLLIPAFLRLRQSGDVEACALF